MAADQKKRQRKLERRAAKRKQRQKTLVKQKQRGLRERLVAAATVPVLHSRLSETVWDDSLGYALLSRELPNGDVAFAMFLVDLSCLGVKDAFGDVISRAEYDRMCRETDERYELIDVSPADVRSLVEGAVAFAANVGLDPHPDYAKLTPMFGDIDASDAEEDFPFGGPDGKPHFVAGPNEGPERCYRILSILEHHCGRDGFHFTVPFLSAVPESLRDQSRLIDEEGNEIDADWDEE